jgi:hypothetical protein
MALSAASYHTASASSSHSSPIETNGETIWNKYPTAVQKTAARLPGNKQRLQDVNRQKVNSALGVSLGLAQRQRPGF